MSKAFYIEDAQSGWCNAQVCLLDGRVQKLSILVSIHRPNEGVAIRPDGKVVPIYRRYDYPFWDEERIIRYEINRRSSHA